jgi:5-methyltetrahydropteroyltriglutamate--homocysteine methyltransferase
MKFPGMSRRATPPFRADHVGSLLRPPELLVARDEFAAGIIDAAQLAAVEDTAIADAVRLQENVGLQSATDGEFRADVAAVYAAEVAGLYELGCRYLQFDDTIFAFLNDPAWRANASASGLDPDRQHLLNVEVINTALAAKPADMKVTIHMCRGNYQSAWFSSGGYDFVAEDVFGALAVDGLFLEYDDERSGTFEPLRFVPDDQVVVLGLVTTKTPELESKDALKRRIDEAAKYVDADRLCISGQCGFASTVEGNALTIDQERAKLELLVETAREVWG